MAAVNTIEIRSIYISIHSATSQKTVIFTVVAGRSCNHTTSALVRFLVYTKTLYAVPWRLVAGLSASRSRFAPGSVHVGYVKEKVALVQFFLRVIRFSPVSIIPLWFSILIHHLGDEQYARWWQQFRDIVSAQREMLHTLASIIMLDNHEWIRMHVRENASDLQDFELFFSLGIYNYTTSAASHSGKIW
jgi:hypothetical protein